MTMLLIASLKTVPSNLLDLSCVVWQKNKDGKEGSCFVYDNASFIQAFSYFRKSSTTGISKVSNKNH